MMVDVLGRAYGWSYKEITEEMYWEQVYDMYELASNINTIEWNQEHHFQLAIHATSKETLESWSDRPIPFPDREWIAHAEANEGSDGSTSPFRQLKPNFRRVAGSSKMTEEQRARLEYVKNRIKEHEKKVAEAKERQKRKKYIK